MSRYVEVFFEYFMELQKYFQFQKIRQNVHHEFCFVKKNRLISFTVTTNILIRNIFSI
jgi:hypothetical protein